MSFFQWKRYICEPHFDRTSWFIGFENTLCHFNDMRVFGCSYLQTLDCCSIYDDKWTFMGTCSNIRHLSNKIPKSFCRSTVRAEGGNKIEVHVAILSYIFYRTGRALANPKGGRQGRAPPPGDPNSFIFMQFSGENGKIMALLGVGAPLSGKSWIRHWRVMTPWSTHPLVPIISPKRCDFCWRLWFHERNQHFK